MYPTLTPADVHPSHDVRDEGIYITDPVCQWCRASAVDDAEALRNPCKIPHPPAREGA